MAAIMIGVAAHGADAALFASDLAFLRRHTAIILLQSGESAVAVAPAYQGRVMTSTFDHSGGPSLGWINRPVIEMGVLPEGSAKGRLQEHIHVFGGEERFWMGPEGGQYALFFKPQAPFEFAHWKTPAPLDTEGFRVVARSPLRAVFQHDCKLRNYQGTEFDVRIDRTVSLLEAGAVAQMLRDSPDRTLRWVGYESDNRLTNRGEAAWTKEKGLLSIWLLGMYPPSPHTTIVIPLRSVSGGAPAPQVNDAYFGKVPKEYLRLEQTAILMKGDGTYRAKIGVRAQDARNVLGSYNADRQLLTLVEYEPVPAPHGYVNSMWERQKDAFAGDALNAYNDGPPGPGLAPLGPFYELETSSPAAALQPGKTLIHRQRTLHLQGAEPVLDPIARRILGLSIAEIKRLAPIGGGTQAIPAVGR